MTGNELIWRHSYLPLHHPMMSLSHRQTRSILFVLPLLLSGISATAAFAPHLQRIESINIRSHHTQKSQTNEDARRDGIYHIAPTVRRTLWMVNKNGSDESRISNQSFDRSKLLLPVTAVVSLSLVTLAAFAQYLPGPPIDATAPPPILSTLPFGLLFSGSCEPYTTSLILRDLGSTLFSIVAAIAFVKSITYPVKMDKLDSRDARKLIHTLSAPLFILVWPLFSNAYGARVFATIVPLLNGIRLFVAGTGTEGGSGATSKNDENGQKTNNTSEGKTGIEVDLANAISRSGDAKEALQGPFVYVIVLLCCTFFFWVDTPIGVVAVATMAVGDGLADLIGRRFGASNKWPFSKSKSIAGSSAFVVGSVLGSFGLLSWLIWNGTMDPLPYDSLDLVGRLCVIAVICAGVELAPVVDDNYSVPIAAGILSAFLLN